MLQQADLLDQVVHELNSGKRNLAEVAKESGVSYKSVLRIKQRYDSDPGYSKVAALHRHLFGPKDKKQAGEKARA